MREVLTVLLCATLALGSTATLAGVAFAQGAQTRPATLTIPRRDKVMTRVSVALDGRSLGTIAITRFHDSALIAIAPLARALHWTFTPTSLGATLNDGTGARGLRVGSRLVREDGTDVSLFNEPLIERDAQLMLALDDAATLFSLKVVLQSPAIALASENTASQGPVTVSEVARPVSRVKATPRPAPTQAAPNGIESEAGQVVIAMEQDAGKRFFRTGIQAKGSLLRANLVSSGSGALSPPLGTVRLGSNERNASFGASTDPLGGVVVRNGLFNGIDIFAKRKAADIDLIAGKRPSDGRSLIAIVRSRGSGSDAVAILVKNGHYDQTVLRHSVGKRTSWGTLVEEWIASERGIGGGMTAKTAGRTFIESTLSFATSGLPVSDNDAPTSLVIGRNFSPALTGTAGLALARGNPLSPFLGVSVRTTTLALSVSGTAHAVSASLGFRGARGNAQVEIVPGINRLIAAQGGIAFRKGQLEFEAASESGSGSGSLQYRTTRPGINFLAGIATQTGHGLGPILGLVLPVSRSIGIEASIKPGSVAGSALHLSLIAGIPARHPRVITYPLALHIEGVDANAPMRLFIDGAPIAKFQNTKTSFNIAMGSHDVFVETLDGTLGSPSRSIDVTSATSANLMLWPQRRIRGRVRIDLPPAQVPQDLSLGGIALLISPGNVSVETDAEGNFVFARQPFDPEAVLSVDPDTIPRGFNAPPPLALGAGDPLDVVLSARRVERQIFK